MLKTAILAATTTFCIGTAHAQNADDPRLPMPSAATECARTHEQAVCAEAQRVAKIEQQQKQQKSALTVAPTAQSQAWSKVDADIALARADHGFEYGPEAAAAAKHYWPVGACYEDDGMRVPSGEIIPWNSVPLPARYVSLATGGKCLDNEERKAAAMAEQERQDREFNGKIPHYDVDAICRQPSQFMPHPDAQGINMCVNSEQQYYTMLKIEWPQASAESKQKCTGFLRRQWMRYPYQYLEKCVSAANAYDADKRFANHSDPFRY